MIVRIVIALCAALLATGAHAASLNVYTGGSMAAPLEAVGKDFTRQTGTGLAFTSGTTTMMLNKIHGGDHVDVVVIAADAMEGLEKEGRIAKGSLRPVAVAVMGAAVKVGAAKPDISTPEKFKAAMLAARSVTFPDPALGAATGVYLMKLFGQMGIADQMKPKIVARPVGAAATAAVANGEAEIVVTFMSEMIANKGVSIIGTLPASIMNPSPYSAGVSSDASDPAAARAFIAMITSPAERQTLVAGGLQPPAGP